jgi:hypothetical protein
MHSTLSRLSSNAGSRSIRGERKHRDRRSNEKPHRQNARAEAGRHEHLTTTFNHVSGGKALPEL